MTVEIANVVGSGDLNVELDLEALSEDLVTPYIEYDLSNYHGLYVRLEENGPLITVYRSGKYIISGCSSHEVLSTTDEGFRKKMAELGAIGQGRETGFDVKNIVCTAELNEDVNLNALSIGLGLESTEYEPEQFPGLIYRPPNIDAVILVFANGKTVITGCRTIEDADTTFQHLNEETADLLL